MRSYWFAFKPLACKFSMKSVNFCNFTAGCPDVFAEIGLMPDFVRKVSSKKVQFIC